MTKQKRKQETFLEAVMRISKLGMKGPADLSINLDHYLYGTPRKKLPHSKKKK